MAARVMPARIAMTVTVTSSSMRVKARRERKPETGDRKGKISRGGAEARRGGTGELRPET
jgi:hypothetical protein